MIRTFIAVDLPEDVQDELLGMQHGVPGARWVSDEQLHLTLRFVGDVDGAQLRDLVSGLSRVSAEAFELTLSGAGFFPPRGPQRVLWIGVERSEPLDALQRSVGGVATRLGHVSDRKKWAPHVTLARLEGAPPNRVARFVAERALYRSRAFVVDAFHLYSSRLHPKGAIYTLEESFPLAGAEGFEDEWADELDPT